MWRTSPDCHSFFYDVKSYSHKTSRVEWKCHEMSICPICITNEGRAYKYTSQEAKIIVHDRSKQGETFSGVWVQLRISDPRVLESSGPLCASMLSLNSRLHSSRKIYLFVVTGWASCCSLLINVSSQIIIRYTCDVLFTH